MRLCDAFLLFSTPRTTKGRVGSRKRPPRAIGSPAHRDRCSNFLARVYPDVLKREREQRDSRAARGVLWGWPGVTPAAILTDPTAGAPSRPWLTSVELHSSDASPRNQLGLCQDDDNKTACSLIAGEINLTNRSIIDSFHRIRFVLMRYSLHETDKHRVVATTVAADRDEALEWFSEKLRVMLTFEGDPLPEALGSRPR